MAGPLLFTPMQIRGVTLKNRVVVAPMHQYAAQRGFATDWHLMNAGRYAAGGAGLVIMESTKVERRGCGTVGDLGIWDDHFIPGLRRCVEFIRRNGAVPGIQLGHSGRKARRLRPWEGGAPLTPSPDVWNYEGWELVSSTGISAPATEFCWWMNLTSRLSGSTKASSQMPRSPTVPQPRRSTLVDSTTTRPAPPAANLPAFIRCQSVGKPLMAEY